MVELLVVIGIIALLVSILMPALSNARKQAQQVKCENHMRQLMMAINMYIGENQNYLPYPNWGAPGSTAYKFGWLFDTSTTPNPPNPTDMESGVLYSYLNTVEVYHCPLFQPEAAKNCNIITSYTMNGATCGFGGLKTAMPTFKITQIPNGAEKVLLWEADEVAGSIWNDGSSYPTEETIATRHAKGANVSCLDGHVEWWAQTQFTTQAQDPNQNMLWWNPLTTTGH